jgi:hypothetical protein
MVSFFPREVLSSWSYNFTNASVDEMVRFFLIRPCPGHESIPLIPHEERQALAL